MATSNGGRGPGWLRMRLLDTPVRWLGIGLGALALTVSGFFGGLDPVDHGPPVRSPGALDEGRPWNVTVTSAQIHGELDHVRLDEPGDRWLAVLAVVEVTATDSRNDLTDILRLSDVDGLVRPEPRAAFLARDLTRLGYLHPGMAERVVFYWEQRGSAAAPTELEVVVHGKTLRISSLSDTPQWLDLAERTRVRLPVEDRR